MRADELDDAYVELCRALARVPPESVELFLASLVLALVADSEEHAAVSAAIGDAVHVVEHHA